MTIFIVLSESPLKVRKIALYHFLISFLVLELLRSKDLKNYPKNGTKNARSWIKSIKINKICDVMWWTSDSKQSFIILCFRKYLSESIETLKVKTIYKTLCKRYLKKLVVIAMMSVPGPFNGHHEMRHNSAVAHQSQFGTKRQNRFSHSSLKILVLRLIFLVPDPML